MIHLICVYINIQWWKNECYFFLEGTNVITEKTLMFLSKNAIKRNYVSIWIMVFIWVVFLCFRLSRTQEAIFCRTQVFFQVEKKSTIRGKRKNKIKIEKQVRIKIKSKKDSQKITHEKKRRGGFDNFVSRSTKIKIN